MEPMASDILIQDTLVIPAAPAIGVTKQIIDLGSIIRLESRLDEVAIITREKGPELLAAFNHATLDCSRLVANIQCRYNKAQRAAAQRAAIVRLDEAKERLTAKGLVSPKSPVGSEDLRDAVVVSDNQYNELLDYCDFLKAALTLVQGKLKAFERAYFSVHKILSPNQNDNLGLGTDHTVPDIESGPGVVVETRAVGNTKIGRPRY